jgi:hypothetical protein
MNPEGLQKAEQLMESVGTEWNISISLFFILSLWWAFVVNRNHKLTIKETLMLLLGIKKVQLSRKEFFLQIVAIAIPLLFMVVAIQLKNPR